MGRCRSRLHLLRLATSSAAGSTKRGRIRILKHRYHVGIHLAGQSVTVEFKDGLLHVTHNDLVVATHARRHLAEDDNRMDRRAKITKPARPTKGGEVLRRVDSWGALSFAGTAYRVGNRYKGRRWSAPCWRRRPDHNRWCSGQNPQSATR